jgi:electron transfer flavoprotein alpha/beta subunit
MPGMVHLEPDESLERVSLHRAVERGNREIWECSLPALFTVEKRLITPRHPALQGILRSKQQTVERLAAAQKDASPPASGLDKGFIMTETIKLSNPKPKRKPESRPTTALSAAERLKMVMNRGKAEDKEEKKIVAGDTEKAMLETERLLEENGVFFE